MAEEKPAPEKEMPVITLTESHLKGLEAGAKTTLILRKNASRSVGDIMLSWFPSGKGLFLEVVSIGDSEAVNVFERVEVKIHLMNGVQFYLQRKV